ncbi:MAG: RNA polymerase sigma factor [Planctomycetota bacterium]
MENSQDTRHTLLARIRDRDDRDAWRQFIEIYTPLVYGLLRRRGLQSADATDVTQDVFRSVMNSIGDFRGNERPGAFRSWLTKVTRSRLLDFVEKRSRQEQAAGDTQVLSLLHQQPAQDTDEEMLEREYKWRIFELASGRIRGKFQESTWEAFWQTNVLGRSTQDVANALGMSAGAVYIARSRVLARLKEQIAQLEA